MGSYISDLNCHDILRLFADLSVACFFSGFDCLNILLFGFFFLFYDSLYSVLAEGGCEFVKAGVWVDGESKLDLEVLFSVIFVGLKYFYVS